MKKILILALLAASLARADDIHTSVTTSTNGNRIITRETLTQDGVTNLFRETYVKAGVMLSRVQRIIYDGQSAVETVEMTDGFSVTIEPRLDFTVHTEFAPCGKLDSISLMGSNELFLERLIVTNGLLYPTQSSEIKKANKEWQEYVKPVMDSLFDEKPKH